MVAVAGRRRRRVRRQLFPAGAAVAGAVGVALAAGLLVACSGAPSAQDVANSYLADWARRDWPAMRALVARPPASFAAVNAAALSDLGVTKASYSGGSLTQTGNSAREPVTQHLRLPGVGTITVRSALRLTGTPSGWRVAWSPAAIAAPLTPGGHLSVQVNWPARAQILGAGGVPLTTQAAMVTIGVEGSRIKSDAVVRAALVAAGAPLSAITTALTGAKAHPSWFEPVFTVPMARYQQLAPTIYPVPGTVFQTMHKREPATPGLSYVVGTVGPVTAEELHALGPPYGAESVAGQTGLENADEKQLAGRPGATITAVNAGGTSVTTVARLPPVAGSAVRTSIDPRVQAAAEQALAGVQKTAALVAVDAATGQLLAVVSKTPGQFDVALDGAYPPGSSFKILTTTALLQHGLTPSSPASCPPRLTIEGEAFHNAEGTAPISDLLHAFAESCNTAFIGLATTRLSAADFTRTAALYRIGTPQHLGLAAYAGSVPSPASRAALAATAIGQGQVLVSPLDMAIVAAAADSGQVRAPRLVAGAADDKVAPVALAPAVVTGLHALMAQVVAAGTATGTGLPAGTYAKTGTAQYGHGNPLPTDAWLVGFNNDVLAGTDLAFAMVTVNGGEGGPTDGPVVARFLDLLHQSGG
ncbi:MAG TPA: penicillin-binding transpeptidase domain-containing protein [Streptosporangiaceae bacterium]|nr:penicillin-binding transpeptidase domain-containing protein [Streptosporangiaceae bacterium]